MIITLTTDFGLSDSYVGQVKGVLLSLAPTAVIVDVTHDIPKFDIRAGARVLAEAAPRFPAGSIHLAIVDPGVASSRRRVAIEVPFHDSQPPSWFVGPDNGIFSQVLDGLAVKAWEITCQHSDGPTLFEGRDVFAPVAAALAIGAVPDTVGTPISADTLSTFSLPQPEVSSIGQVHGEIVAFDSFGNAVTNIPAAGISKPWKRAVLPERRLEVLRATSYEVLPDGKLGILIGSQDFLELALKQASAKKEFNLQLGERVTVLQNKP